VLDVQHTDESLPLRTVIAVRVGLVEGLRTGLPT
jgi:hypothetical protein